MLSNQDVRRHAEVSTDNIKVEVLQKHESAKHLGQTITFEQQETAEIKNRQRAAWAAFHKYRGELTSRSDRLCYRMRLFNIVITPTLTYACGTWTLSNGHGRMIRSAQRKMLRLIVQTKRKYKKKRGKRRTSMRGQKNMWKNRKTRKNIVNQKKKQEKVQYQTQIPIWTVTFPS